MNQIKLSQPKKNVPLTEEKLNNNNSSISRLNALPNSIAFFTTFTTDDDNYNLSETFLSELFDTANLTDPNDKIKIPFQDFIRQNVSQDLSDSILILSMPVVLECIEKAYRLGALEQIFKNHGANFSLLPLYKNLKQINGCLSAENSKESIGDADRLPNHKDFCLNDIQKKSDYIKLKYKDYLCSMLGEDFMRKNYPKLSAILM